MTIVREELEAYLLLDDLVLVQMFDFTLTAHFQESLCRKHRVVVIDAMEAAVRLAVAAIGVSTPQKRRQMGSHQTIPQ